MVGHVPSEGGDYHGPVEVSVALIGAAGAVSAEWFGGRILRIGSFPTVTSDDFRDHIRVFGAQAYRGPMRRRRLIALPPPPCHLSRGFP